MPVKYRLCSKQTCKPSAHPETWKAPASPSSESLAMGCGLCCVWTSRHAFWGSARLLWGWSCRPWLSGCLCVLPSLGSRRPLGLKLDVLNSSLRVWNKWSWSSSTPEILSGWLRSWGVGNGFLEDLQVVLVLRVCIFHLRNGPLDQAPPGLLSPCPLP